MFQDLIFPLLCQAKSRTFLLPPPTIQKKRILPAIYRTLHSMSGKSQESIYKRNKNYTDLFL